jgi:hypothetical protein
MNGQSAEAIQRVDDSQGIYWIDLSVAIDIRRLRNIVHRNFSGSISRESETLYDHR